MQRALIQYRDPDNYDLVVEALRVAHRTDLIGFDEHCLVRPRKFKSQKEGSGKTGHGSKIKNSNRKPGRNEARTEKQRVVKKKTLRNVHKGKNKR